MIKSLALARVEISRLTFHEYQWENSTFLARQVEVIETPTAMPVEARSDAALRRAHTEKTAERGIDGLWSDATTP